MPIPTNPESRAVNMVEDDLLAIVKILPVPASLPQTVNLAYVVEVPRATLSALLVKAKDAPRSVQPAFAVPKQVPSTSKHPSLILNPLANVPVANEVESNDPPVMVNPLDDESPPLPNPPTNVDVAVDEEVIV